VLVAVLEAPAVGAAPPEPAVTEVAPGVRDVPEGLSAPEATVRLGVVPITLVPTPVEPVRPVPENIFKSKPDPEVAEPAPVAAAPVLRPSSSRQEANAIAKHKSIAVFWTFLTAILL
jgi:hypothetical protein